MGSGGKPSTEELAHTAAASEQALASGETLPAQEGDLASGDTAAAGSTPPGPLIRRAKRPSEIAVPRGAQLGRYMVVDKLGGGGMGIVYTAYDPELDRKVALKVMRPSSRTGNEADARARLLREAQAMARLAHPNVVPVYDVGTVGDDVFVAMELVAGTTLRDWLGKEKRGWRTIVAAFVEAGRGLVAAHAAGLVHRDFKPDNVLVGADGRIRVLDFGLARAEGEGEPPPLDTSGGDLGASQRRLLSSPLTRTGALMGTPLYMSPEQWKNEATDARSDQFSFCVALFEALWHTPPFAGKTIADLSSAVLEHQLEPIPAGSDVPARVRDAVLRGLVLAPGGRFPTIQTLLDQLGDDPRAPGRRRLLAVGAVALGAAVGAGLITARALRHPAAEVCGDARSRLAGVWDSARRAQLATAFAASGVSYQADTRERVEKALDAYASSWAAMHGDACRATNVRHEQSEHLLDVRMECLEERRRALAAQVDVLGHADASVVPNAVTAVHQLASLADCADTARLLAAQPLPADAAARAELERLHAALDDARAKERAGLAKDQSAALVSVVARARALGYAPFTAEALGELGGMQARREDYKAADASLHEAVLASETAGDRLLSGEIWSQLVYAATQAGDYDQAAEYGKHGEALLVGTTSVERRSELDVDLGTLAYFQGKYDESLQHYRRALADREKLYGPTDFRVGVVLDDTGITLEAMGKKEEALATHQRAVTIAEQTFGPNHPDVASSLNSLGVALHTLKRDDEALAAHRRALAIFENAFGPDNAEVGATHSYIALVLMDTHHVDDAVDEFTRALTIEERALGPDHPNLAYDLLGVADGEVAAGKLVDAIGHYERALHLREAHHSPPVEIAEARFSLARALVLAKRDHVRAVELATQARDAYRADPAQADNAASVDGWLARQPR